jgi:hypothetical protein
MIVLHVLLVLDILALGFSAFLCSLSDASRQLLEQDGIDQMYNWLSIFPILMGTIGTVLSLLLVVLFLGLLVVIVLCIILNHAAKRITTKAIKDGNIGKYRNGILCLFIPMLIELTGYFSVLVSNLHSVSAVNIAVFILLFIRLTVQLLVTFTGYIKSGC